MRDKTRLLLVTVAVALVAAACGGGGEKQPSPGATAGGKPVRGGVLRLAASNDLVTLDNSQAVSTVDYAMTAGALYEGLYHVDSRGDIVAALADRLPSVSSRSEAVNS